MFSCKNATQTASIALDRKLSWVEWCGMQMHLMMCGACRHVRRRMYFLRTAAQELNQPDAALLSVPPLSAAAHERLRRAIERDSH